MSIVKGHFVRGRRRTLKTRFTASHTKPGASAVAAPQVLGGPWSPGVGSSRGRQGQGPLRSITGPQRGLPQGSAGPGQRGAAGPALSVRAAFAAPPAGPRPTTLCSSQNSACPCPKAGLQFHPKLHLKSFNAFPKVIIVAMKNKNNLLSPTNSG